MSSALPFFGVACLGAAILAGPRGPSARDAERLAMAAQASGRPDECRAGRDRHSSRSKLTIWDRAKQPHLQRYCDLLGRAHGKLVRSPAAAREAALLAEQVLPGKAAPWVLVGRAHVRLRNYEQAIRDFEKARKMNPRSVEDPLSLHDLALAQRHTGRHDEAMNTYRVLVPRLTLLPDADDRIAVLVEAGSLAMGRGAKGLHEATALLREARAQPLSKHDPVVLGMLALALDRDGLAQQAEAVLEALHRRNLVRGLVAQRTDPDDLLAYPEDWHAVVALVIARTDKKRARTAWDRYLETSPTPKFAAHANKRRDALRPRRHRPR